MSPILHVPLSKLTLSPRNARKTGSRDVSDLAANIAAVGVLQNLIVAPSAAGDGQYEVIAGGRRLTALQLLEREGRLPDAIATDGVPCRRIDDEAAIIEASTAENTIRTPLHPADQFDAFKAMVDAGKSIGEVAAHFCIGEVVVKQRLKLANVHPQLVQVYREEGMTLEQLQALAVTDDHKAQLQVWKQAKDRWDREPSALRTKLTAREVSSTDKRVLFVGLAAYVAAGGPVRRDLFSTRDLAYLADSKLLDRLVAEKAADAVAQLEAEGWSWVEFKQNLDYAAQSEYAQHPTQPKHQPLTGEQRARRQVIEARMKELHAEQDRLEDSDSPNRDALEQCELQIDALEEEAEALRQGTEVWPEAVKQSAGVVLTIDGNGALVVLRGRLKPGQKVKAGQVEGKGKEAPAAKKPEVSDALVRRLTAHRTLALQAELANNPLVALKSVVHVLIENVERNLDYSSPSALRITLRQPELPDAPDLKQAPARKALQLALKQWRDKGLPTNAAARRTWIFQQPVDVLMGLLALAAAYSVDAVHGKSGRHPTADALAADLGLDMAAWFQATPDTYLTAVPKALAIEAVAEACGKDAAATLQSLKSQPAIAEAAKKLAGTGWLPKVLRGPNYGTKTQKPTASSDATAARARRSDSGAGAKSNAKGSAKKKPAKKAVAKKKTPAAKAQRK